MYSSDGPTWPLDELLAAAYVTPLFDARDRLSAAERIVRTAPDLVPRFPSKEMTQSELEQAVYELNLTSALIIGDAKAAAVLARLFDKDDPEPEGALVFGCLLHLTGSVKASCFWWQFAAGAGVHLGAYCLYLHHAQRADFEKARYWRSQSDALRTRVPSASSPDPVGPLLPGPIYHALLDQCRRGQTPRLPVDIEIVINQVLVEYEEVGFKELPWPSEQLPDVLAIAA